MRRVGCTAAAAALDKFCARYIQADRETGLNQPRSRLGLNSICGKRRQFNVSATYDHVSVSFFLLLFKVNACVGREGGGSSF